jgi:hypothetical protein
VVPTGKGPDGGFKAAQLGWSRIMFLPFPNDRKYASLSRKDCEKILRNLNAGLAILACNRRLPNVVELQAKSILTVLRNEIDEALRDIGPGPSHASPLSDPFPA